MTRCFRHDARGMFYYYVRMQRIMRHCRARRRRSDSEARGTPRRSHVALPAWRYARSAQRGEAGAAHYYFACFAAAFSSTPVTRYLLMMLSPAYITRCSLAPHAAAPNTAAKILCYTAP